MRSLKEWTAVGLIAQENDGRVVKWQTWPDDLTGPTPIELLHQRQVSVRRKDDRSLLSEGVVDLGKKLRPNLVERQCVLWVEPAREASCDWTALKVL